MSRLATNTARAGGLGMAMAVMGVLAAAAVGAYTVYAARGVATTPFSLRVTPSTRTVNPGHTAVYGITIDRRHFSGPVAITVRGLPSSSHAKVIFSKQSRSSAKLTVTTPSTIYTGKYQLRVRGAGGHFSTTTPLTLVVAIPATPGSVPFGITGGASDLQPGTHQALDLALANPNSQEITVTALSVNVSGITAPNASAARSCTFLDFSVQQFSGSYPLRVPAKTTRTLAALGVSSTQQPQLSLLNLPVNQDGCRRATVKLAFNGTARGG